MNGPYKERWLDAMCYELSSTIQNEVLELCDLPLGVVALLGKWVQKIKRGTEGEIDCFKAIYVVGRFEHIHGLYCHERGRYTCNLWKILDLTLTKKPLLKMCL